MTHDEALQVTDIMMFADGECSFCAASLLRDFVKRFPEHYEAACQTWLKHGYKPEDGWKKV